MDIKKILGKSLFLILSDLFAKGVYFVLLILIANKQGPALYGIFSAAFAFAQIFSFLSELGYGRLLSSKDLHSENFIKEHFTTILISRISILPIILGIFYIVGIIFNIENLHYILLFSVFFVLQNVNETWLTVLKMKSHLKAEALIKIIFSIILFTGIIAYFYFEQTNLIYLIAIFVFAILATSLISTYVIFVHEGRSILKLNPTSAKQLIRKSWPYALVGASIAIYYNLDQVILSYMDDKEMAGNYAAAYRFLIIILTIQNMFNFIVLGELVKLKSQLEKFYKELKKMFKLMQLLQAFGLIILICIYKPLLDLFYSNEYRFVSDIFYWLSINTIFVGFSIVSGLWVLNLQGKEKIFLKGTIFGAILNIILNIILISLFKVWGAILATILSELAIAIYLTLHTEIKGYLIKTFIIINLPLILLFVLNKILQFNLGVLLLTCTVYFGYLYLFKYINLKDIKSILKK